MAITKSLQLKGGLYANLGQVAAPKEREIVFTTDSNELWVYNGGAFKLAGKPAVGGTAGRASVEAKEGRFYFDTEKKMLSVATEGTWHDITVDMSAKMNLVGSATQDHIATFDGAGQVKDSTYTVGSAAASATQLWTSQKVQEKLDELVAGASWRTSVKTAKVNSAEVSKPQEGDRVLINGVGQGEFSGHDHAIATKTSSGWTFEEAKDGWAVFAEDTDAAYNFTGTEWVTFASVFAYTAGNGIDIQGKSIAAKAAPKGGLLVDGTGIKLNAASASVAMTEAGKLEVAEVDFGTFGA